MGSSATHGRVRGAEYRRRSQMGRSRSMTWPCCANGMACSDRWPRPRQRGRSWIVSTPSISTGPTGGPPALRRPLLGNLRASTGARSHAVFSTEPAVPLSCLPASGRPGHGRVPGRGREIRDGGRGPLLGRGRLSAGGVRHGRRHLVARWWPLTLPEENSEWGGPRCGQELVLGRPHEDAPAGWLAESVASPHLATTTFVDVGEPEAHSTRPCSGRCGRRPARPTTSSSSGSTTRHGSSRRGRSPPTSRTGGHADRRAGASRQDPWSCGRAACSTASARYPGRSIAWWTWWMGRLTSRRRAS